MSVITISRQMSSYGDEIAAEVAGNLGWRRVSRDLINQAARAAGVPQVALADIDELGVLDLRPAAKEWQAYRVEVERIIGNLAQNGHVVILGRGGQMVLREFPEVLHVRVVAPVAVRVARLRRQETISADAAAARLEASHKTRSRYLQKNYGVSLNDPALYHLVINTGLINIPRATDLILYAYRELVHH